MMQIVQNRLQGNRVLLMAVFLNMMIFLPSCLSLFGGSTIRLKEKDKNLPWFISLEKGTAVRSDKLDVGEDLEADFWFETYDPEIGTFEKSFAGMMHEGNDTYVSVMKGASYKKLNSVPGDVSWELFIKGPAIRKGLIFLVKSSKGRVFKVRLVEFSDGFAKLQFALLKK